MLVTNILFSLSYTGSTNCQAHKSTQTQRHFSDWPNTVTAWHDKPKPIIIKSILKIFYISQTQN